MPLKVLLDKGGKVKRIAFFYVVFCIVFFSIVFSVGAEILTNDSVVKMVKAGLTEDIIISKIKASDNAFDVSVDAILELKNKGVSNKIIDTMIKASSKESKSTTSTTATAATNPFAALIAQKIRLSSNSLYVKENGRMLELSPIIAQVSHSMKKHWIPYYFGPGDDWHYLNGEKTAVRIHNNNPIFYTKNNPASFQLVKLSYHSGKNIRYVVSTGGVYKATIPIKFQKREGGMFEIIPEKSLEPGEYAFINGMTFYDFGIE